MLVKVSQRQNPKINQEVIIGTHQDSTSGLPPQKVCAVPIQKRSGKISDRVFPMCDCPNFNSHNCLECFPMISNTTLLGDTIAATLAALPRLPPLLLPSWLTIPPWLGCWLFSCCIARLVKDGGEQEMCGSECRKCIVGEGDMDKLSSNVG